ncbi:MAG: hypothetical protein ACQEUZ_12910 [Pseudomonadota bacterium]
MLILAPGRPRFERFRSLVGLDSAPLDFAPLGGPGEAEALGRAERALLLGEPGATAAAARRAEAAGMDPAAVIRSTDPRALMQATREAGGRMPDPAGALQRLVAGDFLERAYYAYPMMLAAAQARRIGLPGFVAVELGVWRGEGLLNLASLARTISDAYGLEIRVAGFDTGAGMPDFIGWPDHPELWHEGDLKMPDPEALRRALPDNAELILGDVAETVPAFAGRLSPDMPLGFVSLDVDFYSSSVNALKILDNPDPSAYLPAVPIYVDDSYIGVTQHELSGEALAIHMRNLPEMRRIEAGRFDEVGCLILRKRVRPRGSGATWHHCMWFAHMHRHPLRREKGHVKLPDLHHTRF